MVGWGPGGLTAFMDSQAKWPPATKGSVNAGNWKLREVTPGMIAFSATIVSNFLLGMM